MTKADIVENVYEKVGGFSKKEAAEIVETVFDTIKETLERGEKIKISGFGNFVVQDKKRARGPQPANRPGDHDQRAARADVQAQPGAQERAQRLRDAVARGAVTATAGIPGQAVLQDRRDGAASWASSRTCFVTGRPSSARSNHRRRARSSASTSGATSSSSCASATCCTPSASRSRAHPRTRLRASSRPRRGARAAAAASRR